MHVTYLGIVNIIGRMEDEGAVKTIMKGSYLESQRARVPPFAFRLSRARISL